MKSMLRAVGTASSCFKTDDHAAHPTLGGAFQVQT